MCHHGSESPYASGTTRINGQSVATAKMCVSVERGVTKPLKANTEY